MRVCQVIDRLTGGGQERVAVDLARGLAGSVEVSALLATRSGGDYEDTLRDRPVSVFVARRSRRRDPLAWSRIYSWLRRQRFDILHTHSPGSLAAAIRLSRLPGLSYRIVAHLQMLPPDGTEFRAFAEHWYKSSASRVSAALVTNESLRRFLVDTCGYRPADVSIVVNPVDFTRWDASAPRPSKRQHRDRIIMVAQWRPAKDHITAIRAANLLAKQGRTLEWLLVGEPDVVLSDKATSLIEELRLQGTVRILGRRKDVPQLLADSDVGVLATHHEGQPVAVLEYGAAGLPSIVSCVEGTEMLIGPEKGVLGVAPRDPVALADAVADLLDNDEERTRLGAAAATSSRERASLEVIVDRVLRLYEGVIVDTAHRPTNEPRRR